MRVTLTGATGLIGTKLVAELKARGDEITVLSRSPERAAQELGVEAVAWEPREGPALETLEGRDVIVHLAGEPIAQRWNELARRKIEHSRERATRNIVNKLGETKKRPKALISASAIGYYGPHGDKRLSEDTPPGDDFAAQNCILWEREAAKAEEIGMRVARIRTGIVLDASGGALAKMLPFFKLGIGGPVAGGKQYMSWIGVDDLVAIYIAAIDGDWSGPFNATAPEPVTNKAFSKALGRALKRPAFLPVPGFALKILYGQMSEIVITGQRVIPSAPLAKGFKFKHTDVDEALRDALAP